MHVYRSDACEHGIGGYSLTSGRAWRWEIPVDCRLKVSLNCLEFISCYVTIWIDILKGQVDAESCLLSQTDSTSAEGWLRKSNFDEDLQSANSEVARTLATTVISAKCCLYSQWFEGKKNDVSDALSRDHHIPDSLLTSLLSTAFPHQLPNGLTIKPLPKEIGLWLTCLLQKQTGKHTQSPKQPQRSNLGRGVTTPNTVTQLESVTHYSAICPARTDTDSWGASPKPCGKPDSVMNDMTNWQSPLSTPPWTTWLRPFGLTTGLTQDMTRTENWHTFYSASSVHTGISTLPRNHRKL